MAIPGGLFAIGDILSPIPFSFFHASEASVEKTKVIRDPLYGYIECDPLALSLLDTPEVQRLRRVRQLGFAFLVYPGANHSRFEHSLGVYHLAGRLPVEEPEFRAAALLHDVGHSPYSHASEALFHRVTRTTHEERPLGPRVVEALESHGLRVSRVARHIRGETPEGRLLAGELDVDRMDYLVRDAYYTGVAFGRADVVRLIEEMGYRRGRVYVRAQGLQAAESLLVARALMYPTVYLHHVCRIAEAMFSGALEAAVQDGADPGALRAMDDYEANIALRRMGGVAAGMVERINSRRLYKRALYEPAGDRRAHLARTGAPRLREAIARRARVPPERVLVDLPPMEPPLGRVDVEMDGGYRDLRRVSPLVSILDRAHRDAARVGVYTEPRNRAAVARAARRVLEL
ncbi:MAG: HD domain-containing protein [Euryarchaeota archaeon]|nr:HD domain-containing protein [Euryarchaeota archaeon]